MLWECSDLEIQGRTQFRPVQVTSIRSTDIFRAACSVLVHQSDLYLYPSSSHSQVTSVVKEVSWVHKGGWHFHGRVRGRCKEKAGQVEGAGG